MDNEQLLQAIYNDMQELKQKVSVIEKKVDRLETGQSEIKKELYMIDRRISDTYKLVH